MIQKLITFNAIFTMLCGSTCAMIGAYELINDMNAALSMSFMVVFYILTVLGLWMLDNSVK